MNTFFSFGRIEIEHGFQNKFHKPFEKELSGLKSLSKLDRIDKKHFFT